MRTIPLPSPCPETARQTPGGLDLRLSHRSLDDEAHRRGHPQRVRGSVPSESCWSPHAPARLEPSETGTSSAQARREEDRTLEEDGCADDILELGRDFLQSLKRTRRSPARLRRCILGSELPASCGRNASTKCVRPVMCMDEDRLRLRVPSSAITGDCRECPLHGTSGRRSRPSGLPYAQYPGGQLLERAGSRRQEGLQQLGHPLPRHGISLRPGSNSVDYEEPTWGIRKRLPRLFNPESRIHGVRGRGDPNPACGLPFGPARPFLTCEIDLIT